MAGLGWDGWGGFGAGYLIFFYFIICRVVGFWVCFFFVQCWIFYFFILLFADVSGLAFNVGCFIFFRTVSDILFFYFIGRAKKGRSGGRYTRARIPDTPAAVANVLLWNVR